jgi:hypothetical protein
LRLNAARQRDLEPGLSMFGEGLNVRLANSEGETA